MLRELRFPPREHIERLKDSVKAAIDVIDVLDLERSSEAHSEISHCFNNLQLFRYERFRQSKAFLSSRPIDLPITITGTDKSRATEMLSGWSLSVEAAIRLINDVLDEAFDCWAWFNSQEALIKGLPQLFLPRDKAKQLSDAIRSRQESNPEEEPGYKYGMGFYLLSEAITSKRARPSRISEIRNKLERALVCLAKALAENPPDPNTNKMPIHDAAPQLKISAGSWAITMNATNADLEKAMQCLHEGTKLSPSEIRKLGIRSASFRLEARPTPPSGSETTNNGKLHTAQTTGARPDPAAAPAKKPCWSAPYPMSKIAARLGIDRSTLYRKIAAATPRYELTQPEDGLRRIRLDTLAPEIQQKFDRATPRD